jgi:hypothetical protein
VTTTLDIEQKDSVNYQETDSVRVRARRQFSQLGKGLNGQVVAVQPLRKVALVLVLSHPNKKNKQNGPGSGSKGALVAGQYNFPESKR